MVGYMFFRIKAVKVLLRVLLYRLIILSRVDARQVACRAGRGKQTRSETGIDKV